MSLVFQDIYHETQTRYHLNLLAGENGLSKLMSWVYISEDLNTSDFLLGGELVITTGVSSTSSRHWLYDFIKNMIDHDTCGVILNISKYIFPEDITQEILDLCNENDFPLLTMPWEIHIYDITRDYYNRIFLDTQTDTTISRAFVSVIRHDGDYAKSISVLEDSGFSVTGKYCICTLDTSMLHESSKTTHRTGGFSTENRLLFLLKKTLKKSRLRFHLAEIRNTLLFICNESQIARIQDLLDTACAAIAHACPDRSYHIGIGSIVSSLARLGSSHAQSLAAISMAKYHKTTQYSYENMGFFKILLAVNDRDLLSSFVEDQIGKVLAYDNAHSSNYTETLHQYLLCDGSIQAIATALFCHRNTINYRVHALKETFGYNLDDPQIRFHLLTAYLILEYREIMKH